MPITHHVALHGSDASAGTGEAPFRTIDRAARQAMPGDIVTVHEGTYREWVRPRRGGLSDERRIVYQAAPGERVVITGAERVTDWRHVDGGVWTTAVPNTLFGEFNPFAEEVAGDWIAYPSPAAPRRHLGEVYLDGRSGYEADTVDEVFAPPLRARVVDHWTGVEEEVRDPDSARYPWHAEVSADATTIWANFQGADPTRELVEINVRRSVFTPTRTHLNWITVRGFELAQAATPWAPPTADQPGLVGPNWAKGWIIEDNLIRDAKCAGVSLGKEASTGHNYAAERGDKPGYQYQLESVFAARRVGWDREHIGSHIVRRNTIRDCGQAGIVGHLGCVFSTIEDNHISRIAIKREFYGYEIAGIKLHAAIDVVIRGNHIHDCTLGTWLDWQAQGTRVTRNVYHDNRRDLFVEVSHGPYVVDHNVFGSPACLELFSQGGAFVGNLVLGTVSVEAVVERPTPYHLPHSTQVAGYGAILGGDDRFVGNVFLGGGDPAYGPTARATQRTGYGTSVYDGHPAGLAAYLATLADPTTGDHERFSVPQPVYVRDNVYLSGAAPYVDEERAVVLSGPAEARVRAEGEAVYLETTLPAGFDAHRVSTVSGTDLVRVRLVDAEFEERDGTPVRLDVDLLGERKAPDGRYAAGPLVGLPSGTHRTRLR